MDDSWRDSCSARRETERCDGHLSGNHNYFQSGLQVKRQLEKGKSEINRTKKRKNERNDFLQDDLLDKEVIKAFG